MIYVEYEDQWREYNIIIADNVSYNEFMSKYEVINVNGKILRVREIV